MSRLSSAVLAVALLLAVAAPPAPAFVHTAQRLYTENIHEEAVRLDDFSDPPPEKGIGWELYRQTDDIPLFTDEMIRDEHLMVLVAFERDTSTILPILSARMYLLYNRVLHRHMREAEASQKTRVYGKFPDPGIPLMLKLLFPSHVEQESAVGLLRRGDQRNPSGRSVGLLGWLFEEEGVFSGNEWNWENFLPRILSVTALVVVGLLFIEFLRFLVLLGIRSLSQADRKRL
ncbi:MAG: hypothetical protein KJ720_04795 [Proteobacteria bacterium]|nr:hypothetical protein [Pseudomonadota bacterium]MBU1452198.1 hypothetical protein [Pseudomonadota bacterium]MBU2468415.1 hypothetical protein [Pseudomonadota bacterium]MBU2519291.1 hypothetical protein [Pseudomonadota bacterium]